MRFANIQTHISYSLGTLLLIFGALFLAPQTDQAEPVTTGALDIVVTYDKGAFEVTCSSGCDWAEISWVCDDEGTACSVRLTERGLQGIPSSPKGE
jgi:hypothetical protein